MALEEIPGQSPGFVGFSRASSPWTHSAGVVYSLFEAANSAGPHYWVLTLLPYK